MTQTSLRSSSTNNTPTYRYTPLANPSQTRLLQLVPGKWDDPINCVIEPVDLDEKPTYKALSYTWGDPDRKASILVGESHLIVTENLRIALQRLRHRYGGSQKFWIDGVCINQADSSERTTSCRDEKNLSVRRASSSLVRPRPLGEGFKYLVCRGRFVSSLHEILPSQAERRRMDPRF